MSYALRQRTPFARWMWECGLKPQDLERELGKSWESIRRYALDYDDPQRRVPDEDTIGRIVRVSAGVVTASSFLRPGLGGAADARAGDLRVLAGARSS